MRERNHGEALEVGTASAARRRSNRTKLLLLAKRRGDGARVFRNRQVVGRWQVQLGATPCGCSARSSRKARAPNPVARCGDVHGKGAVCRTVAEALGLGASGTSERYPYYRARPRSARRDGSSRVPRASCNEGTHAMTHGDNIEAIAGSRSAAARAARVGDGARSVERGRAIVKK